MKTALSIKGITFGLTLIFWATSIPTYAATAVQPGSVCSKQGMTKIYQGKKYSCKKSGNKLVWDKGVAVSKPKSTSNAGATASKNVELPAEGSKCTKIGEKIVSANRTMRCSWAGHANTTYL